MKKRTIRSRASTRHCLSLWAQACGLFFIALLPGCEDDAKTSPVVMLDAPGFRPMLGDDDSAAPPLGGEPASSSPENDLPEPMLPPVDPPADGPTDDETEMPEGSPDADGPASPSVPQPEPEPEDEPSPDPAEDGQPEDESEPIPEDEEAPEADDESDDEGEPESEMDASPERPLPNPIDAPERTWSWLPIEGTHCADGSPTGVGVNLAPAGNTLVILLQPGGACWDGNSCYGFPTAFNLDGYGADKLLDPLQGPGGLYNTVLFDRNDAENPLADAHYAFVPYCTGDLFAGRRVTDLEAPGGEIRETHFVGYDNLTATVRRLAAGLVGIERVWLVGSSAGGYGILFNWPQIQATFPDARLDIIMDSSAPIQPEGERWDQWRQAWTPVMPAECADCETGLPALMTHLLDGLPAPSRLGFLTHDADGIISGFFGYTADTFLQAVTALDQSFLERERAASFVVEGDGHGLISPFSAGSQGPDGTTALMWIRQLLRDDPAWGIELQP